MSEIVKKLETEAKERLYKELYEWIDVTGVFPRGCSYEGEVESFINDGVAAGIEIGKAIAALQPSSAEREELAKWCEKERERYVRPEMVAKDPAWKKHCRAKMDALSSIAALLRTPVAVDGKMVDRFIEAACSRADFEWGAISTGDIKRGLEAALQAGRK